jgi:hypothetical protein
MLHIRYGAGAVGAVAVSRYSSTKMMRLLAAPGRNTGVNVQQPMQAQVEMLYKNSIT